MVDLRQFEKRLNALGIEEADRAKTNFTRLTVDEVRTVRLMARASGRAPTLKGVRILPADWQARDEMRAALWAKARELQDRDDALPDLWEWFDRRYPQEPENFCSTIHH